MNILIMKNITGLVTGFLLLFIFNSGYSQEEYKPYTAKSYWTELNRPEYRFLKQREINNETLSNSQKKWLEQYEKYLGDYFEILSKTEKENYYQNKQAWYVEANLKEIQPKGSEGPKRDTELLLKHIGYSGASGLIYGIMLSHILDLDETKSTGLTMVMAGGSMLYPILSPQYNNINNNSLWLRSHGKIAGGIYGYSLGMAIYSDNIKGYYDYTKDTVTGVYVRGHDREALAISLAASYGLGVLGFRLGKKVNWSDGRVSLYQYYGYAVPALTSSIIYSTGYDEYRGYGINVLLSAPIGYLAATKVSQLADYTRGDITALVGLTAIGAAYGTSLMLFAEWEDESAILAPTLAATAGSAIGHFVLSDTRLSRPEGRRVNYAAIGGGLIGFGVAFFIEPDDPGWYVFLPATTSLIGYSFLLRYYKARQQTDVTLRNKANPLFHINFYPENLLYTRIDTKGYIPPLVSASLQF